MAGLRRNQRAGYGSRSAAMFEWLQNFLAVRGLAPHGYCLLWEPELIWTHVVSDVLIAAAYFSIPFVLGRLLTKRKDVEFGWMVGLFAVFIFACGMTHVMGVVTLWIPAYGWEALIKVITALASVATAALLIPLLPRLVAIPSPAQLQRANEALRYEAEMREKTEAMLRQSQKMEAIGQLTGGIAHDFNNLLGIVITNLDRLRRHHATDVAGRSLDHALAGAERAAALVDQLLAFARQQPLLTARADLNAVIEGVRELIPPTMGGAITTEFDLSPQPLPANVDRSLLESALVNLAINARDAMDQGGRLTFTTRLRDGLVEIGVTDTGCGMSPEVIERATEPFFTTKAPGKGSGLGLSQVVGSIEQMGGRVEIESQQGTGTTVRLLFPVAE
jgi:signal transduction histidine kinase